MTQPNRETARDALAALLNTRLVTTDTTVQAVYSYRKGNFGSQSPIVCVSSAGSARERVDFTGTRQNIIKLTIHVFVLYAATGWTEAEAEDRLDAIEAAIADVVDANSGQNAYWLALDYDGDSARADVAIGGVDYIMEAIPIAAQMAFG
jgi:hypothetical protein